MKIGTVVVVDDENVNRIILKSIINDIAYVLMASGGNEAVNTIIKMERPPDLILLDIVMPGMNGFEFMEVLKNIPKYSNIPIMIITSQSDYETQTRAISMGAVDFISRPFNNYVVKTRVKSHIELKKYKDSMASPADDKASDDANTNTEDSLLDIISNILDNRYISFHKHSKHMCRMAEILIGNMLKSPKYRQTLTDSQYDVIIRAIPYHDIGKIGIPDSILLKPGKLSEKEYEVIKTHTVIGSDIIKRIMKDSSEKVFLAHCYDICRYHHERWEGKGYPDSLQYEDIPLSARITALLDVYDALTRQKVYKAAYTHKEAVDIMIAGRGSQFDPYIIDSFLEVHDKFKEITINS